MFSQVRLKFFLLTWQTWLFSVKRSLTAFRVDWVKGQDVLQLRWDISTYQHILDNDEGVVALVYFLYQLYQSMALGTTEIVIIVIVVFLLLLFLGCCLARGCKSGGSGGGGMRWSWSSVSFGSFGGSFGGGGGGDDD